MVLDGQTSCILLLCVFLFLVLAKAWMESNISPEILTYEMQNGNNMEDALFISWFEESEICCNFHW